MKFLLDFFPIVVFFAIYKFCGIYLATASAIAVSLTQLAWLWIKHRRFESIQLITLVLIIGLGGATLLLHNDLFIKWKPTAIDWAFALAFLISQWVGKKPLAQQMLDANIRLPESVWSRLNLSWAVFFAVMGAINLYVVYHFDTNTWVNFKLFGMFGATLVFVLLQALYMSSYVEQDNETC